MKLKLNICISKLFAFRLLALSYGWQKKNHKTGLPLRPENPKSKKREGNHAGATCRESRRFDDLDRIYRNRIPQAEFEAHLQNRKSA